jgi:glycosyltransferase involved in cell wall biosynthesis
MLLGAAHAPAFERELRAAAGTLALELGGSYGERELERGAATCDLAAFPSRLPESYGLVVDEALALGLPAWVGDRGALSERLGGAGRVLPAEDVPAWAAAFAGLVAEPAALAAERARVPARVRGAAEAALELERLYAGTLRTRGKA